MGVECEARREKRIARFLRDSKLPLEKTLSSFQRQRLPQKVDAQLNIILDGSFRYIIPKSITGNIIVVEQKN